MVKRRAIICAWHRGTNGLPFRLLSPSPVVTHSRGLHTYKTLNEISTVVAALATTHLHMLQSTITRHIHAFSCWAGCAIHIPPNNLNSRRSRIFHQNLLLVLSARNPDTRATTASCKQHARQRTLLLDGTLQYVPRTPFSSRKRPPAAPQPQRPDDECLPRSRQTERDGGMGTAYMGA